MAFVVGIGGMIAQTLEEQLFRWLRAAELTCDRAALLVAQDPKVCYYADVRSYNLSVDWLLYIDWNIELLKIYSPTPQEVVISVLMKLAGGCPSMADQLNVDAFLEQARSYEKAASSPIGWYIRFVASCLGQVVLCCNFYFFHS